MFLQHSIYLLFVMYHYFYYWQFHIAVRCYNQEESIFKQCKFSKSAWCLSGGQFAVVPKDEGHRLMVSPAFVGIDFDIGMKLTKEQLDLVYIERRGGIF
jgi:hypothetical protein